MHVVLLSGTAISARNGSSKVERRLARELTALGHRVTLLTRDTAPLEGEPFEHLTYQRPSSRDWKSWLLAGRMAARLRELGPDVVHAFHLGPPAYFAARSGLRYVVTHHDMRIAPSPWNRRALAQAAHVVALNDAQAAALSGLGARAVTVISNGVGGDEARPPERALPPGFVLFAGRFEAEKGVLLLLDSYARIEASKRPPLVLAGDGRDAVEVRARAAALGATVLPWLDHAELLGTLSAASALALPSFTEASPLLLLEAYLRGVPVVAHDLPMIAGELRDAQGEPRAALVPVGDAATWADRLAAVGSRDEARVERARAHAAARSWRSVAERYAAVHARVAQR